MRQERVSSQSGSRRSQESFERLASEDGISLTVTILFVPRGAEKFRTVLVRRVSKKVGADMVLAGVSLLVDGQLSLEPIDPAIGVKEDAKPAMNSGVTLQ